MTVTGRERLIVAVYAALVGFWAGVCAVATVLLLRLLRHGTVFAAMLGVGH